MNHPIIWGILIVTLVVALVWLWWPFPQPQSHQNPAKSYDDAVARFSEIAEKEKADPTMDSSCYSQLLASGRQTERVVVMFVGFTNCPIQMSKLGAEIQKSSGDNVLILNAPRQGQKTKTNYDLGNLTTQEVIDYGNTSIDIAAGLGKHITVTGLSVGGVVSAWTSQNRSEVDKAVNMAPVLMPYMMPGFLQRPVARIMNMLSMYIWWDVKNHENKIGSPYAYNGFPTKALGKYLEVASFYNAGISAPHPKNLKTTLVLNGNDKAINSPFAARQAKKGSVSNGQDIEVYRFAKSDGLDHDILDPYNPLQKIDYTYPILINLIVGK